MANGKWASAPSPEQISKGVAMFNLPNVKLTIARIADTYGNYGHGVLSEYERLVLRSAPIEMRSLNPKVEKWLGRQSEFQPGASIAMMALRMEELIRLQNQKAAVYPHSDEFRNELCLSLLATLDFLGPENPEIKALRARSMVRVGGKTVTPGSSAVVEVKQGDAVGSVYQAWSMVVKEQPKGQSKVPPAQMLRADPKSQQPKPMPRPRGPGYGSMRAYRPVPI